MVLQVGVFQPVEKMCWSSARWHELAGHNWHERKAKRMWAMVPQLEMHKLVTPSAAVAFCPCCSFATVVVLHSAYGHFTGKRRKHKHRNFLHNSSRYEPCYMCCTSLLKQACSSKMMILNAHTCRSQPFSSFCSASTIAWSCCKTL